MFSYHRRLSVIVPLVLVLVVAQSVQADAAENLGPNASQVKALLTRDLSRIAGRAVSFTCQMNHSCVPMKLKGDAVRRVGLDNTREWYTFVVLVDREVIGNPYSASVGPIEDVLFLVCTRQTADYIFENLSKNERYSQDAHLTVRVKSTKDSDGDLYFTGYVDSLTLDRNPGDKLSDSFFPGARGR